MNLSWCEMSSEKPNEENGPNLDHKQDKLAKLWPSLSNMSPDELRDHIRFVRRDRRVRKETAAAKKTKTNRAETQKSKIKKVAEANPELIARLLAEMGTTDGSDT
jgi:hypothetical protein